MNSWTLHGRSLCDHFTGDAAFRRAELGGGGMSRVFVAEDTRLGRRVVVKVLPPELAGGINAERFQRLRGARARAAAAPRTSARSRLRSPP